MGDLEAECWGSGAVAWQVIGEVLVHQVRVEVGVVPRLGELVVHGVGLDHVGGEVEEIVLEAVEAELLHAGSESGGYEGGE